MARTITECSTCRGRGSREVQLTDGTKAFKKCFICDGRGQVSIFTYPKKETQTKINEPAQPEQSGYTPGPFRNKIEAVKHFLNADLGDLSWINRK